MDYLQKELDEELRQRQRALVKRKALNAVRDGKIHLGWDLDADRIEWPDVCPVLGIKLNYWRTTPGEDSPSFDRIDPDKGYLMENVRVISNRANTIKNSGTAEEHEKIAAYMRANE